jgi:hypothetical protein
MEKEIFFLSPVNNNKLIKLVEILFGLICIFLAGYWVIFNIKSIATTNSLWISILFLTGFGFYMIWAGAGKATGFIEIDKNSLKIKNTLLSPVIKLLPAEIETIQLFPFKILFILKTRKKVILRLSSTWYETNEKIVDSIILFAGSNEIRIEDIEEKI